MDARQIKHLFDILAEVQSRATRTESKLVRFAEELGLNIENDPNWLTVNNDTLTVYVGTLGRSMLVIQTDMKRNGALHVGKVYDLVHRGENVGSIVYQPNLK
jgi:dihydroxyacetone kinase-like predicted kinase